jgi:hypothetical protein
VRRAAVIRTRMQTDLIPGGAVYIPAFTRMSAEMRDVLDILGNGIVSRQAIASLKKQAEEDDAVKFPAVRYISGKRLECFVAEGHQAIKAAVPGELPGIKVTHPAPPNPYPPSPV